MENAIKAANLIAQSGLTVKEFADRLRILPEIIPIENVIIDVELMELGVRYKGFWYCLYWKLQKLFNFGLYRELNENENTH